MVLSVQLNGTIYSERVNQVVTWAWHDVSLGNPSNLAYPSRHRIWGILLRKTLLLNLGYSTEELITVVFHGMCRLINSTQRCIEPTNVGLITMAFTWGEKCGGFCWKLRHVRFIPGYRNTGSSANCRLAGVFTVLLKIECVHDVLVWHISQTSVLYRRPTAVRIRRKCKSEWLQGAYPQSPSRLASYIPFNFGDFFTLHLVWGDLIIHQDHITKCGATDNGLLRSNPFISANAQLKTKCHGRKWML